MEKPYSRKNSEDEYKAHEASLNAAKDNKAAEGPSEIGLPRTASIPKTSEPETSKRNRLFSSKPKSVVSSSSSKPQQNRLEKSILSDHSKMIRPNEPKVQQVPDRARSEILQQGEIPTDNVSVGRWQGQRYEEVSLSRLQLLERKLHQSEQDRAVLERQYRAKDAWIDDLTSTLKKKDALIAEQDAQLAEQAHSTRKAQERVFEMVNTTQWSPEATAESKRSLDSLYDQCKSWSKRHAFSNLQEIYPLLNKDLVFRQQVLLRVCAFDEEGVRDAICNKSYLKKSPSILLSAVLLDQIYSRLFQSPFRPLDYAVAFSESQGLPSKEHASSLLPHIKTSLDQPAQSKPALSEELGVISRMIELNDPNSTHLWRAQTLRYLDPLASQLGKGTSDGQKDSLIAQARRMLARSFVEEFLDGEPGKLVARPAERAKEQLLNIAYQACEVAYRLWTQKPAIEILNREASRRTLYSRSMHDLELHPYHIQDIEDNEQALEGRPIALFVHPIVLARGSYEGTDYNRSQVWKKGMVWLG